MATFDIVSRIDMQLFDNAINVAKQRVGQRYDFKGAHILLELNKKDKTLKVEVPDDMKLRAVQQILIGCLMDQGLSPKTIDWGKEEEASLGAIRLTCKLVEGIEKDVARDIVAKIKESGIKVKAIMQADQVRVDGKQIDDLQEVIAMLKATELPVALQYINMKR